MALEENGPHSETYAGDERAAREAAAAEQGGGGWLGGVHRAIAQGQADQAADVYAEGQAERLGQGVEARGGPSMPGTYYLGYEHPAMKNMVETNMDPGQVDETGAAWNSLGNTMVEFQTAVAAAVGRSGEDWSGAAGEAARGYFSGVGAWMGGTGQAFQLAANRMNAQSEAAATAKSAMPEPVDFSMADAMDILKRERNPLSLPNTINQINQRFAEKQQAHERAAEVMTTFAQTMGESGSGMPAFAPVPAMTGTPGEESGRPDDGGPVGRREGGDFDWERGGGGPVDSPGISEYGGGPRGSVPPSVDTTRIPSETPVQSWQPPSTGGPPPVGGEGSGVRPAPVGQGSPGPLPVGGVPVGSGSPAGGPGAGGGARSRGPGSARGFEAGGERGLRSGAGGEAGSGGRGPGGRLGAGGEPGPGGRGPGGLAGEHPAGRGAGVGGAGRAAGGGAMGPMGAGGRGQGDEDREHQRPSYLEEPDPEGVFGTDERTAPPVIGEDDG